MKMGYHKKGLLLLEFAYLEEDEDFADDMVENIRAGYEAEVRKNKERRKNARKSRKSQAENGRNPY